MKKRNSFLSLLVFLIFSLDACHSYGTSYNGEPTTSSALDSQEISSYFSAHSASDTSYHQHTYDLSWSYDSNYHWHESTCGHDVKSAKEKHVFDDTAIEPTNLTRGYTVHTCSVCGYSYTDSYTNPLSYTITWKNWDGSVLETDTNVAYGSIPSYNGATPIRDSTAQYTYTFSGWSPNVAQVTGDATYTAQYSEMVNAYTITWKNWDGSVLETDTNVAYGSTPSYDGVTPTKSATAQYTYTFSGWSPSVSQVTGDATYTAQFSEAAIIYSISYELNGGTADNPSSYSIDTGDFDLNYPIKNGYNFIGWTGSNGSIPQKDVTILCNSAKNLEFTAHWELAVYNITYHLFDGNNSPKNPSSYTTLDTVVLANPWKEGNSFDGWFTDALFTNQITSLNGQYGDLDLYAKFTPNTYECFFDSTDSYYTLTYSCGDESLDKVEKITKNDIVNIYNYIPTKSGFIFDGWFDGKGNIIKDSLLLVKDTVLYAGWHSGDSHNLSRSDAKISANATSSSLETVSYSNDYYMFLPTYCDGNTTFSYRVTAKTSDNGAFEREASAKVSLYDFTDKIYIFSKTAHKYMSPNSYGGATPSYNGVESVALTPGHAYKISASASAYGFGGCDGFATITVKKCGYNNFSTSLTENINIDYDSEIDSPSPHKDGYDFVGWFDENDELVTASWEYLSDKSFHPKWSLHNFNIDYVLYGGTNNDENPIFFTMNDVVELKDPTREGYSFGGWYTDAQFKNKVSVIEGNTLKDYTLYAKWTANQYTVTLDYDGGQNCPTIEFVSQGSVIRTVVLYNGSTLNYFIPDSPSQNLIFGGWYTNSECTQSFDYNGLINTDLTLYAKWLPLGSNDNFVSLGDSRDVIISGTSYQYLTIASPITQTITVSSKSDLDLFGAIFDSDMNLLFSSDDISAENLDFSITFIMEAGKTYYVGYKANQALASGSAVLNIDGIQIPNTFITGGYSDIVEITVTYDSSFNLPIPKKEGYIFAGWYDESGNLIDTSSWKYTNNITIHACWIPVN